MGTLSEGCISHIISFTSPRDSCRWSLVSPLFKLASDSNVVWEKFLPSDYGKWWDTIPETIKSKKELYFYLCDNPIRIDNGNKILSIDRESGKKRVLVGASGLSIARVPQHRQWIAGPELAELVGPEFAGPEPELAELVGPELAGPEPRFPGLHVTATVERRILSPQTTYEVYLVFNFAGNGHDFQNWPVQMRVDFKGREDGKGLNVFLDSRGNIDDIVPQDREDGWKEVVMGGFFNKDGEDGPVLCSLQDVDDFRWKYGLIVEGIEVRPKHV